MMSKFLDHAYIVSTLIFTVYSQAVIRWQVSQAGALPVDLVGKVQFVAQLFLNPWVLSSIVATLFAGISWMLTMSRFEISYAYPWVSLNFVLMLLLGVLLFEESLSFAKVLGTLLVVAGIVVIARS
jgi:multidrug transporter EmrE-like cation transporter